MAMRLKNLDTGEEYDLEEFSTHAPGESSSHSRGAGPSQPAGPQGHIHAAPEAAGQDGGKRRAWLDKTGKLKNW
jgi:hypothetical protein